MAAGPSPSPQAKTETNEPRTPAKVPVAFTAADLGVLPGGDESEYSLESILAEFGGE
jgi:hypothetical protein